LTHRSPIIIFTYLRIDNLKITIKNLGKNYGAQEYDLFIFSDGPKYFKDKIIVEKLREYLKTIDGFKSVTITESEINKGLASSVIFGVSEVLKNFDRAIVLEDDLITSPNFLEFMNASLNQYENESDVISISGYSFPKIYNKNSDAYLLNRSWSWGWATWRNRWDKIDWQVNAYSTFSKDQKLKKQFSALGSDVNLMLKRQMEGKLDSWLIRFVFHQFQVKGITVYPTISKVTNNGWDEFASNNKGKGIRFITDFDLSNNLNFKFPESLEIETDAQNKFLTRNGIWVRIKNKFIDFIIRFFE
jgi:hypothetical protein